MTPEEHIKRFDKTIKEVENNYMGELMVKVAISACTLIKERVIEKGINAEGQKFAPYSTKDMLIGAKSFKAQKYATQILGSKAKRKELEWRTIGGSTGFSAYMNVSAGGSGSAGGGSGVRLAILKGGYKRLRDIQGLPTDHVNFSITNQMWNDILVRKEGDLISTKADHMKGTAIIGPKLESEKKKLAGNVKRRGTILDLNKWEIDDLKRAYNLDVLQIFRNNGL